MMRRSIEETASDAEADLDENAPFRRRAAGAIGDEGRRRKAAQVDAQSDQKVEPPEKLKIWVWSPGFLDDRKAKLKRIGPSGEAQMSETPTEARGPRTYRRRR